MSSDEEVQPTEEDAEFFGSLGSNLGSFAGLDVGYVSAMLDHLPSVNCVALAISTVFFLLDFCCPSHAAPRGHFLIIFAFDFAHGPAFSGCGRGKTPH
jgi:hypothetical protein